MTPLVIAHRGACWKAAENSLEAFELAIEEGADYVEFDVRVDADGRLVLSHDPVPDPCPPDLCKLDEALTALRGRVGLAVEIEDGRAAKPALEALHRHRCDPNSVILLSFAIRVLETTRRLRTDLRTVLNLGRSPDPAAGGRFWGVGFDDAVAKPKPIRLAQSLGLATLVFTVNEPARMRELAELGVTGIFSDRPRLLRETLASLPGPERERSRPGTSRRPERPPAKSPHGCSECPPRAPGRRRRPSRGSWRRGRCARRRSKRERRAVGLLLPGRGARPRRGRRDHCRTSFRPSSGPLRTHRGHRSELGQSLDESPVDLVTWRADALERLASRRFDLLVIGGGIIGAGIANEAGRAGLAVALVDRGDFGAATSSSSSKLIHGGLRYLRLGDVRLVREAHQERRALMRVVAPHLVRRLTFLLPLYPEGPYRRVAIQTGLWLYSTLARERLGGVVAPERAAKSVPGLRLEGLEGCGLYSDAWTHDARLCLANVRAAADHGAVVLNYAEAVELSAANGRIGRATVRDLLGGEAVEVEARAVVNASGPWIDRVRVLEDPAARPSSRLSKGVHALLALDEPWSAALIIPHDRVRVSFAVPWEGMLLLGTTDSLYESDSAEVAATEDDVEQILAEAAVALDSSVLRREAVRSTFAGLRVLPGTEGSTASARRETVLLRGPRGMLTIAGGKLTTYRRIALDALGGLRSDLGLPRLDRRPAPLPGAADLHDAAQRIGRAHPELELATRLHLAHFYGTLAAEVLALADEDPGLLQRLHPDAPDIAAQAAYARASEWACTDEDVLARRTTLALRGLTPEAARLPA